MRNEGRGVPGLQRSGQHGWVLVRRIAVGVVGVLVTAAGIVLSLTPGPGLLVLLLGLSILATEFSWARTTLTRTRRKIRAVKRRWEMTHRSSQRPRR